MNVNQCEPTEQQFDKNWIRIKLDKSINSQAKTHKNNTKCSENWHGIFTFLLFPTVWTFPFPKETCHVGWVLDQVPNGTSKGLPSFMLDHSTMD